MDPIALSTTYDFWLATSGGLVEGITPGFVSGINRDVRSATDPEDVWNTGGVIEWLEAAAQFEIVSDNAADTALGTGARTVAISALDANWNEIDNLGIPHAKTYILNLNGTTPVPVPIRLCRVNDFRVIVTGSSRGNVGTVTLRRAAVTPVVHATIAPGESKAHRCMVSSPANYTIFLTDGSLRMNVAGPGDFGEFGLWSQINGVWTLQDEFTIYGRSPPIPISTRAIVGKLPPRCDIRVTVRNVMGTTVSCSASLAYMLAKD